MTIRFTTLISTFSLFTFLSSHAQNGPSPLQAVWQRSLPYITQYLPREYNADVQVSGIAQDDHGIIYAANSDGVVEFDGISWRLIKTPLGNPVRSLVTDSNGRVYVGGADELGYLDSDPSRGRRFHSLLHELDTGLRHFGNIWITLTKHDSIYFIADHHILRWANGKFKVWGPLPLGFAWTVRDQVYVDTKEGLTKFTGDSLVLVSGGGEFRGKQITALLPHGEKEFLALGAGSYRYDGKHLVLFPKETEKPASKVYTAIQLSSGYYAVATTGAGVYLLDNQGIIRNQYTRKEGLSSNMINGLLEDKEGDLWVATNNGINRIELNSPVRLLNEMHGLEERVNDLAFFNDNFYVATASGMFRLNESMANTKGAYPLAFEAVVGLGATAWECKVIGNSLMVSNHKGLYSINPENQVSTILKDNFIPIVEYPARNPDHLFYGTEQNYIGELFRQNGSWKTGAALLKIPDRPNEIIRKADGNVLINTTSGIIYEIDWTEKKKDHLLEDHHNLIRYDSASGLPIHVYNWLTLIDTISYVSNPDKGVYRFDAGSKTFKPDTAIMTAVPYKTPRWATITPAFGNGVWFITYIQNQTHLFKYEDGQVSEVNAVGRFSDLLFERILDQDSNILAIASSDKGVILYNKAISFSSHPPFKTVVRKAFIGKDSVIYAGYRDSTNTANFKIPYATNDLRLQFSLPSYDLSSQNQYQYLLAGSDKTWSSWSNESQVDFTNLSEGNYTFRVRGKNIYGQVGKEDTFIFTILPPWYRTWWAYGLYVISFAALVIELINWRIRKLKLEKVRLEKVILERTEEIRQQAEKLKEMDLVKSRFFANISHEFRTPLSLILAPIQEKLNTPDLSREEKESTLLIRRNANRLLALVNQLLDLSKLENGKMMLHIQQGNLGRFISDIASSYDLLAENNKIRFLKNINLETFEDWYDADKLEKIINNVLFNAFKFTPPGGTITLRVSAESETGYLQIEIQDTGKGIPEDEQQHVFSPFYQSRFTDDGSGTGLGLSLVKELVTLHGGHLELKSTPHQGTTINMVLPRIRERFPAGTLTANAPPDDREKTPGLNPGELAHLNGSENGEYTDAKADTSYTDSVLIIEDNAELRDYIAAALCEQFRTLVAQDGEEGLRLAMEHTPSLIISDIMMPGMTGVELTSRVKTDIRTSHIPVVLLTAKVDQGSRMEGLAAGADDYLTKPFYTEELRLRVTNLIEQRKKLASLFMTGVIRSSQPARGPSLDEKFIQKIREITEANISNFDFSVEKMAEEIHLSRSQLFRKLKSVTGLTPTELINDMRLQKAAELILANTDKLSQIGYSVGFKEPSYFSKSFRKKFGVNPSEYAAKA